MRILVCEIQFCSSDSVRLQFNVYYTRYCGCCDIKCYISRLEHRIVSGSFLYKFLIIFNIIITRNIMY